MDFSKPIYGEVEGFIDASAAKNIPKVMELNIPNKLKMVIMSEAFMSLNFRQ